MDTRLTLAADRFDDDILIPSLTQQMGLGMELAAGPDENGAYFSAPEIDLDIYDKVLVMTSGGKDSLACLVKLIELGVDLSRVELHHHSVDGREGSTLMDWPCVEDYCQKVAEAFGIPIYYSWIKHGFEGEMLKDNSYSHPDIIETPDGLVELARDTNRAKPATRRMFPQASADLSTRWCSSVCKISVGNRLINNQPRFNGQKILVVEGIRREEGGSRKHRNQFERHSCDRRNGKLARHVDLWRPVLEWSEAEVWDSLRRARIIAPVPYRLGWSRSSCRSCIFTPPRLWATLKHYYPGALDKIARYEEEFGVTINRQRIPLFDVCASASRHQISDTQAFVQSLKREYTLPVLVPEGEPWKLPDGAFGDGSCGPS